MSHGRTLAGLAVVVGLGVIALVAMRESDAIDASPSAVGTASGESSPRRPRGGRGPLVSWGRARSESTSSPLAPTVVVVDAGVAPQGPSDVAEAGVALVQEPSSPAPLTPEEEEALRPRVTRLRPQTDEERMAIAVGVHDFVVVRREEVRAEIRALEASDPQSPQLRRLRRILVGLEAVEPDVRARADAVAAEVRQRATAAEPTGDPPVPSE